MNLSVALFAQDLIDPTPTATVTWDDKHQVRLSGGEMYGYFTAGEASLIATAWDALARELHEREVDRLQGLPSQESVSVPTYVTTVETIEGDSMYVTTVENLPITADEVAQTLGSV